MELNLSTSRSFSTLIGLRNVSSKHNWTDTYCCFLSVGRKNKSGFCVDWLEGGCSIFVVLSRSLKLVVDGRWCECGKARNLKGEIQYVLIVDHNLSSSPTVVGVHPLSHNCYVRIHVSVPACWLHFFGSLTVYTGCLLLPIGEEQGSDMACPFNSLQTFDMPSAEVSLTYFPLAALLLSRSAHWGGGVGGRWGRSCLRLHCCPGVLNHCHLLGDTFQCVHVLKECRRHHTHTQAHLFWGLIWSAPWGLQVDAGQDPCSELCLTHFMYHCSHPLTSSTYFTSICSLYSFIPFNQLSLLSQTEQVLVTQT